MAYLLLHVLIARRHFQRETQYRALQRARQVQTGQHGYIRARGSHLAHVVAEEVLQVGRHAVFGGHVQLRVARVAREGDRRTATYGEYFAYHVTHGVAQRAVVDVVGAQQAYLTRTGVVGQAQCTVAVGLNHIAVAFAEYQLELQQLVDVHVQRQQTASGTLVQRRCVLLRLIDDVYVVQVGLR